uniref:Uncharacterized protein n=1 Tax=Rhizophora mucronata TaxID=61149 RepID=A0A2P2QIL9_RHIMU
MGLNIQTVIENLTAHFFNCETLRDQVIKGPTWLGRLGRGCAGDPVGAGNEVLTGSEEDRGQSNDILDKVEEFPMRAVRENKGFELGF